MVFPVAAGRSAAGRCMPQLLPGCLRPIGQDLELQIPRGKLAQDGIELPPWGAHLRRPQDVLVANADLPGAMEAMGQPGPLAVALTCRSQLAHQLVQFENLARWQFYLPR